MLRVEKLVKIYSKRRVVDGVSLEVQPGEVVGLLGPNGAGKTTTFRMTLGLIDPNEGGVFLDGREITGLPMYKRARMGISFLPQERSIFRPLTVRQNVLAILETLKLRRAARMKRLDELLAELDLTRLADSKAQTLSGGEKRRLEITRALVLEPGFILLDEPFAALDPIVVGEIQAVVRRLRDRGIGVLLTDHSVRETLQVTDRSYIINEGRILVHGDAAHLIADPEARRVYLGDTFDMPEIEVRRHDQTRALGLFETGLAFLEKGEHEKALGFFEKVDPGAGAGAGLHRARAACHLARGDTAGALEEARRSVDLEASGLSLYYRGLACLSAGDPVAAMADLERARALAPELPIAARLAAIDASTEIEAADLLPPE